MNTFQKLAQKLIGIKTFKSTCNVIQYVQEKNDKGRVVYIQSNRFNCNCIVGNISNGLTDSIHKFSLYIIVPTLDLIGLNLDNKLKIELNGKTYNVQEVTEQGFVNNQILTYRFILTK